MANATTEIKITEYAVNATRYVRRFTVAAGKKIYRGTLVMLDDTGKAIPAEDLTGLQVVGIAENTASAGETVDATTGFFTLNNAPGSTAAKIQDINRIVGVYDDNTIVGCGQSNAAVGILRFFAEDGRPVVEVGNQLS